MLKRLIAIILGVLVVAVLSALVSESQNMEVPEPRTGAPLEPVSSAEGKPNCGRPEQRIQAGDVIDTVERLTRGDYLIQTRHKMSKLDVPREYGPPPKPVKVSYLLVKHKGKTIKRFDVDSSSPVGNSAEAGFFSLLGTGPKQLIVSQEDGPKTGVQWVADFSKTFKVIFDGQKFRVGRESYDMTMSDYDGDGVNEIVVPITAFYGFENWRLYTGETPLPDIIFKYNPGQREYLPANPEFKECLLRNIETLDKSLRAMNEQPALGRLMAVTLDYILVGEESRGWSFFDETCKLPDKFRIKDDMQRVLNEHPVYRFLFEKSRLKKVNS
jgi:hypothetical protein